MEKLAIQEEYYEVWIRKPSLKKSFKARTTGRLKRSVKKALIPVYGKKGMGYIKNPKRAVYNKVYNKTTVDLLKPIKPLGSSKKKKAKQPKKTEFHYKATKYETVKQILENEGYSPDQYSTRPPRRWLKFIAIILGLASWGAFFGGHPNIFLAVLYGILAYAAYQKSKPRINILSSPKSEAVSQTKSPVSADEKVVDGLPTSTPKAPDTDNDAIPHTKVNLNVRNLRELVPPNVFDLLWFINGPYKNIERETQTFDNGFYSFEISFQSEPSAINVHLPIIEGTTDQKIGYYPAYDKLTSVERFTYLKWLQDISQPIDISYVFIFYYGLERFLFTEKIEQAVEMIFELKKYHFENNSFNSYSNDAILIAAMMAKRPNWIARLNLRYLSIPLYATIKGAVTKCFTTHEIILFTKKVGWTNPRYIKNEPQKFEVNLALCLKEKFATNQFIIQEEQYKEVTDSITVFLANYSLSQEIRFSELPDILSHPDIQRSLHALLQEAHERTKLQLREERKMIITE